MQSIILISLLLWSIIDPSENLALVILVGLLIAVASATQDITVDALRIEQIGKMKADRWLRVPLWQLLGGGAVIN